MPCGSAVVRATLRLLRGRQRSAIFSSVRFPRAQRVSSARTTSRRSRPDHRRWGCRPSVVRPSVHRETEPVVAYTRFMPFLSDASTPSPTVRSYPKTANPKSSYASTSPGESSAPRSMVMPTPSGSPGGTLRTARRIAEARSLRRALYRKPGWDAPVREPPTPAVGHSYFLLRVKFLVTVDFFLIFTVATVGWKPSLAAMTSSGLLRTSSHRAYPPSASVVSV